MADGLDVAVDGAVVTLTLDRPEALNALTIPLKEALLGELGRIAGDDRLRVVILTGAGRAFCAGQDLQERMDPSAPPLDVELRERYNPIVLALRSMRQPVIAAVNGVAAGAGASLAFACDLRIAAVQARFVLAFGRIGLIPDSGATWLLPRLVGLARATDIAFVGDPIEADEALRIGLVRSVVPGDRLADEARKLADRLAAASPASLSMTKAALAGSWSTDLAAALDEEARLQGIAGAGADHAEGLAAFFEKRTPRFLGE
jgi:2-(1,2-epoxy-1,2-dihydrophenyl)acetyl-CoA isomerase